MYIVYTFYNPFTWCLNGLDRNRNSKNSHFGLWCKCAFFAAGRIYVTQTLLVFAHQHLQVNWLIRQNPWPDRNEISNTCFPIIIDVRGLRLDMLRFPCVCIMYTVIDITMSKNISKQKRSTEGCSKFKSPETRQAQERLVSTLEHMQVQKWDRTRFKFFRSYSELVSKFGDISFQKCV